MTRRPRWRPAAIQAPSAAGPEAASLTPRSDPPTGAETAAPSRRAVAAWALIEFALLLFSINVVSLYFPLWLVDDRGARDSVYALATSAAMAVMVPAAPLLGALFDHVPRRLPLLAGAMLLCAAATATLGLGPLPFALAAFVVAAVAQQSAGVFADALLPAVSTPATRGAVGGVGIAVGYSGAIAGIALGLAVLARDPSAKPTIFRLTALVLPLLILPALRWIPDPAPPHRANRSIPTLAAAPAALRRLARDARAAPGLARLLVGRLFYADAANTLTAFMAIYATAEIGFDTTQTQILLLLGIVAGIGGGLAGGRLVDRIGPKRGLDRMLALWLVVFAASAAIPLADAPGWTFWGVAPIAGFALGGAWAADRPLLLRLAPPDRVGQFFGLYALVGRFAAIGGPLLWALVVDGLGWGRPTAVLTLGLMTLVALAILRPINDGPVVPAPPA